MKYLFFLMSFFVSTWAAAKPAPHIVMILLDDLDEVVSEPYLQQAMPFTTALVRSSGVQFSNAHSAAICCEARAAILTGRLAHNNGVFTNGGEHGGYKAFLDPLDNEALTFARYASEKNYYTMFYGKYMNGYEHKGNTQPPIPQYWEEGSLFTDAGIQGYLGYDYHMFSWQGKRTSAEVYGTSPSDYNTDVLTAKAVAAITQHAADSRPMLLYLNYTAPHLPIPPAPRHKEQAERWVQTLPQDRPNFFADGDAFTDKPTWLRESLAQREAPQMRQWAQRDWQQRLGSLLAVDEGIEQLWETLGKRGVQDNTILIITSDNGYNHGAHSLIHKMAPYEESIRVPLWVVGGKDLHFRQGVVEERWTQHVDHFATILDVVGAVSERPADGVSYLDALQEQAAVVTPTNKIYFAYQGGYAANGKHLPLGIMQEIAGMLNVPLGGFFLDIPTHMGIKVKDDSGQSWKLIYWPKDDQELWIMPEKPQGEWELYDLRKDPFEMHNLIHHPDCQSLKTFLQEEIRQTVQCSGEACRRLSDAEGLNETGRQCVSR